MSRRQHMIDALGEMEQATEALGPAFSEIPRRVSCGARAALRSAPAQLPATPPQVLTDPTDEAPVVGPQALLGW
jgi:hypothetical protein